MKTSKVILFAAVCSHLAASPSAFCEDQAQSHTDIKATRQVRSGGISLAALLSGLLAGTQAAPVKQSTITSWTNREAPAATGTNELAAEEMAAGKVCDADHNRIEKHVKQLSLQANNAGEMPAFVPTGLGIE